jgi:hypothetical protein
MVWDKPYFYEELKIQKGIMIFRMLIILNEELWKPIILNGKDLVILKTVS